jgi:hypothetical protein
MESCMDDQAGAAARITTPAMERRDPPSSRIRRTGRAGTENRKPKQKVAKKRLSLDLAYGSNDGTIPEFIFASAPATLPPFADAVGALHC